jgi:hypothetical protein
MDIINWIQSNPVFATIIVALIATSGSIIGLIISTISANNDRKLMYRQQRFENFHKLLSDLVEGREGQKKPRIDSQIAVVYELRNYPEYRELSLRILEALHNTWINNPKAERIINEINLTINALKNQDKWKFWIKNETAQPTASADLAKAPRENV